MLKELSSFEASDASMESTGFFKRFWHRFLEKRLPRRIKRLIFISTIMALVKKIQEPNMELISQLNNIFQVTREPQAFLMPMKIKNVVWKNSKDKQLDCPHSGTQSITELLSRNHDSDDYLAIGQFFAKNAPPWIRYGAEDLMSEDASLLIKQLKKLDK